MGCVLAPRECDDRRIVPRRTALALLLSALVVAASAQSAAAAPPPTLTGQRFFSSFYPYGPFNGGCEEDGGETVTWRFSGSRSTTGPYAGTFRESGTVTFRIESGIDPLDIVSLESEFLSTPRAARSTEPSASRQRSTTG
jgi:hypothetical protein